MTSGVQRPHRVVSEKGEILQKRMSEKASRHSDNGRKVYAIAHEDSTASTAVTMALKPTNQTKASLRFPKT